MLQLLRQAALLMVSLRSCLTPGLTHSLSSPRQLLVRGSYGDTVLLQLIAANCDSAQFAALVQQLVRGQRLDDSYVSQQLGLGKKNDLFQMREERLESDLYSKQQINLNRLNLIRQLKEVLSVTP